MRHASRADAHFRAMASSRSMLLECLGIVGELCLVAPSAERALVAACHFSALWSSWPHSVQRARGWLLIRAHVAEQSPCVSDMLSRTWLFTELAHCVSGIPVLPQGAYFARVPEHEREVLRASFACAVQFDHASVGLGFRVADLQRENVHADARLFRLLGEYAEECLSGLNPQPH